jgi:competence protein ComEA
MRAIAILVLVLHLNTATVEQLERLPGVGPALAKRIVDFREKKGGFKRIEELLAVPGVSEKKWKAIREYLVLN